MFCWFTKIHCAQKHSIFIHCWHSLANCNWVHRRSCNWRMRRWGWKIWWRRPPPTSLRWRWKVPRCSRRRRQWIPSILRRRESCSTPTTPWTICLPTARFRLVQWEEEKLDKITFSLFAGLHLLACWTTWPACLGALADDGHHWYHHRHHWLPPSSGFCVFYKRKCL